MKSSQAWVPGNVAGHRVTVFWRRTLHAIGVGLLVAASAATAQDPGLGDRDAVYRVVGTSRATQAESESLLWVHWTSSFIELQDPDSTVGYAYHRLRGGRLELFQLFHPYETAIRYELRDAWLFDESADFANELQFWDGSLRSVLERREDGDDASRKTVEYFGTVDDAGIELRWLKAEQIPDWMQITTPGRVVRFERLSGQIAVDGYDWPDWEDTYEDIDFVDLGDREEHPIASLIHSEHHIHSQGH
jgi:hypothetical protein